MENLDALLTYQKHLDEEEEFITKLLRQIDQQINSLQVNNNQKRLFRIPCRICIYCFFFKFYFQVEQMELQSTMHPSNEILQNKKQSQIDTPLQKNSQQLDLSVPVKIKNDTEEEEDEDDEEL